MGTNKKISVGIVGANPSRGFASIAHIPAMQALADFEITAVCLLSAENAVMPEQVYVAPRPYGTLSWGRR